MVKKMKPRPFYNIAHHCNTQKEVDEAIEKNGANAIECDITPLKKDGKIEFMVYHPWDFFRGRIFNRYTRAGKETDSFFCNLKRHLDQKKLAMIMFDCKAKKGVAQNQYAEALVSLLKKHGIHEKFCLISVPGKEPQLIKDFYAGLGDFNAAKDAYNGGYAKNNLDNWIRFVKNVGATFIGLGIDAKVFFSRMSRWIPWIQRVTKERDEQNPGAPKKVLFWTLNTKGAMRKTLDYGVDGIITNFPKKLNQVLKEHPYCEQFRLATQNDSLFEKHDPLTEKKAESKLSLENQQPTQDLDKTLSNGSVSERKSRWENPHASVLTSSSLFSFPIGKPLQEAHPEYIKIRNSLH